VRITDQEFHRKKAEDDDDRCNESVRLRNVGGGRSGVVITELESDSTEHDVRSLNQK
jgi:hypothetical protein